MDNAKVEYSSTAQYSTVQESSKGVEYIIEQACCAGCRRRPSHAEVPPIGKIHAFSEMAVTIEPLMGL